VASSALSFSSLSKAAGTSLESFGARLTQVITQTGLTQAEFARRLGASAGFVSDVARGNKKPGAEFLCAVRTIFGASVDWLLTGEGSKRGREGIDLDLMRTIRLLVAIARAAVIEDNTTAKALILLMPTGRLQDEVIDDDIRHFLNNIAPKDDDADFTTELYNGHLWIDDPSDQRRKLLAAAIVHFETRKPIDRVGLLTQP
jgi:transcriptional regulator with XRE-family HTH domain